MISGDDESTEKSLRHDMIVQAYVIPLFRGKDTATMPMCSKIPTGTTIDNTDAHHTCKGAMSFRKKIVMPSKTILLKLDPLIKPH